jgi:hypothetical protein
MSLFVPTITVTLTPAEVEILRRPVVGTGGHQGLLNALVPRIDHDGRIDVEDDELQRAARYAYAYGGGGYQGRFKTLLAAARRSGWSQV